MLGKVTLLQALLAQCCTLWISSGTRSAEKMCNSIRRERKKWDQKASGGNYTGCAQVAAALNPRAATTSRVPALGPAGPCLCPGHGPGLPRNQPLGCQGLPQRRRKRLKAKIQLESETLVLHSSHPSKCPVAALKNCCSKVYFQHRNKQCDSIPQKWDPCNTNRKLSTVVL